MGFYKSFLNLSQKKEHTDEIPEKTVDGAIEFSQSNVKKLIRRQILTEDTEDYYVAFDTLIKTEYICFKHLLMLDIDTRESYIFTDNFLIKYFNSFKDMCFAIHKSKNGHHVFVISKKFNYDSRESVTFMLQNFCDFFYCCHSYTRGYSVRISTKPGETGPIYKDLGIFGNKEIINTELLGFTKLILQRAKLK